MPLQPIDRELVLNIVRTRGPCIPNDIRQQLKLGDTILLGAMLSEMASKGLVKISHVKKGGSPYYYDPAQPQQLEKASESLNEKDRRAYALLKEKKVLRDDEHEALMRVCLRSIKDFAIPFEMHNVDGDVLFWKHFLVPELEARRIAFGEPPTPPPPPSPPPQQAPPTFQQQAPRETRSVGAPESSAFREPQAPASPQTPASIPSEAPASEPPKKRVRKAKPKEPKSESQQQLAAPSLAASAPSSAPSSPLPSDDFTQRVLRFFEESKIRVVEQKAVKKGELEFVIAVPTPVGEATYFCKARSKKSSSDGDLASAKLQGMARGLPVIYLTDGDIAKRAQEMLASELKGVVVKKL